MPERSLSDESTSLSRRATMTALGGLTLPALANLGGAATDPDDVGPRSLAELRLPSWHLYETHEEPIAKANRQDLIQAREVAAIDRSITQLNLKMLDEDDVAQTNCSNDTVGIQHRFVATTTSYMVRKPGLQYDIDKHGLGVEGYKNRQDNDNVAPARNPGTGGISGNAEMEQKVTIGGDAEEECGNISFKLNNIYQTTLALDNVRDLENTPTAFDEYSSSDVEADIEEFQRTNGPNEDLPQQDSAMHKWLTSSGIGSPRFVAKWAGKLGTAAEKADHLNKLKKLDLFSGYADELETVIDVTEEYSGTIEYFNKAADVGGILASGINFFDALDAQETFEVNTAFADDGAYIGSINGNTNGQGEIMISFVDFTVTVPPGQTMEFEVEQNLTVADTPWGLDGSEYEGDDLSERVNSEKTWRFEIPALENDIDLTPPIDQGSSAELEFAHPIDDNGNREQYAARELEQPSITIQNEEGKTGSTFSESDTLQFEATPNIDESRIDRIDWKIYKSGGSKRPATFTGQSCEIPDYVMKRGGTSHKDPTISPFGPGTYTAEVLVRDQKGRGRVGMTSFEVEAEALERRPLAVASAEETTINLGETVSFDGSESLAPDNAEIDLYEWEIQYPEGVSSEVDPVPYKYGEQIEHEFEYPGMYIVSLRTFSNPDFDGDPTRNPAGFKEQIYSKTPASRPNNVGARDITVIVKESQTQQQADLDYDRISR